MREWGDREWVGRVRGETVVGRVRGVRVSGEGEESE